ncbi:MAG: kelch repeat-containing protein, partial [Acidimicrobiales bacterium]
ADGRVVVVGGVNPNGQLASTEVYDPGPGSWTASGALATPRANHTATALPDGRVMVAGGMSGVSGSVLSSTLPSVVLFDVSGGKWTPAKDMGSPRYAHTASTLPSGKILVVGGLTESGPVAPSEAFSVDRS